MFWSFVEFDGDNCWRSGLNSLREGVGRNQYGVARKWKHHWKLKFPIKVKHFL